MQPCRFLAVALAGLIFCVLPVRGETPPSPLRLVPEQAGFMVQVEQPRRIVDTLQGLKALDKLWDLPPVQEQLDSTRVRLFRQLVAYLEKELGAPWPELFDRLAGGGIALSATVGTGPQPALLVVQGRDEKLMQRFEKIALTVLEQELARQESNERIEKGDYHGVPTFRFKKDIHLAVAGSALLVGTTDKALQAGLDRHLHREKKSLADVPSVAEARRSLPGEPLAWLWLDMPAARKSPEAKAAYKSPRDDPGQTVLFGGYLDLLGRTPLVAGGLYRDNDGLTLTLRMPRGRDGMGPDRELHVGPKGQPGTRPLLEPRGVLYSDSGYLDVGRIWLDRKKLFNENIVKQLEEFDKTSGKFLSGMRLNKLLTQAGSYYRIVVANQAKAGYKKQPQQPIPAFAVVWELRQPEEFTRSMTVVLNGAALLASTQVKLKRIEEKHQGCQLTGWRFSETAPLADDVNDVRFNFSPCFVRVGNQFVAASTLELGRELVDLLRREERSPQRGQAEGAVSRVYAGGIAEVLAGTEDQLIATTILDQAVAPGAARAQVKDFLSLVRQLGTLRLEATYGDKDFHYDIRWQWGGK
jgi:hypothetical protein